MKTRFFYVRNDKRIKEVSVPFVESELRRLGFDKAMRGMYLAQPWKVKCDSTLWLVPNA